MNNNNSPVLGATTTVKFNTNAPLNDDDMRRIHSTSDIELSMIDPNKRASNIIIQKRPSTSTPTSQGPPRVPSQREFNEIQLGGDKSQMPVVHASVATSIYSQDKLVSSGSKPSLSLDAAVCENCGNAKTSNPSSDATLSVPQNDGVCSPECDGRIDLTHPGIELPKVVEQHQTTFQKYNPVTKFINGYHEFEKNLLKRSSEKRDNQFRSQLELVTNICDNCDKVLHTYPLYRIFMLAVLGGCFIALGTLLSAFITSDLPQKASKQFSNGIAFICTFAMIVLSRGVLFTEVNISVSVYLLKQDLVGIVRRGIFKFFKLLTCYGCGTLSPTDDDIEAHRNTDATAQQHHNDHHDDHPHHHHHRLMHWKPHLPKVKKSISLTTLANAAAYWGVTIMGNICGIFMMAAMLNGSLIWHENQSVIQMLSNTSLHKVDVFEHYGAGGWFMCFVSGMIANFLIGIATLIGSSAVTIIGRISGLAIPIFTFAAIGPQHSPANIGYFAHSLIWRDLYSNNFVAHATNTTLTPEIKGLIAMDWRDALAWNVIPSALGNAAGGFLLGFIFVFIFIK